MVYTVRWIAFSSSVFNSSSPYIKRFFFLIRWMLATVEREPVCGCFYISPVTRVGIIFVFWRFCILLWFIYLAMNIANVDGMWFFSGPLKCRDFVVFTNAEIHDTKIQLPKTRNNGGPEKRKCRLHRARKFFKLRWKHDQCRAFCCILHIFLPRGIFS